ncbi:biotin attachment protein [Echinicola strongylocentroti]|uniref:Biotin attachment protein n=1 Tax=Echinicola strongylocentroti TaxID=1795355 RepID=A0A2Z4IEW9_9BACT|nr:HlyD family efflux transporter periplasmic adaptor subunit [Echinicola strongylocentroti]AWW29632.1 biotin attachment protein [Echinicola strongylocentroti]
MLNISENSINNYIKKKDYKVFKVLEDAKSFQFSKKTFLIIFAVLLGVMFAPWTQNIQTDGYVTTRSPEQRPQSIQSVISGRLERWYVKEGDFVDKGDTLVYISDAKSEYFDPNLLERTQEQLSAKTQSGDSYDMKVEALRSQYQALKEALGFKLRQLDNKILQATNKVAMDSMDLVANKTNLSIAQNQLQRTSELHKKGLKSLTELQEKELKVQETQAKVNVQQNKLTNQRNELLNLDLEISSTEREYRDKLAKVQSDIQTAMSAKLGTVADASKLQNQLRNYTERQERYYITAPQSGYITKTVTKGIGEIIKEGTDIMTIVPDQYDLAVEVYVRPQDLPLVHQHEKVRLRFDGWPAIVISGWPEASTGIFSGHVVAMDRFISNNGYYRLLVTPDPDDRQWPERLSIGTGARAFLLLNDVPLWYELWRQLNGFPTDYYSEEKESPQKIKLKAPLKSVK